MGEAARRKKSGNYSNHNSNIKYEFVVLEWNSTPHGNRILDIRHHYLHNHKAAGDMAESISEEFYEVDEYGNQSGTPVAVITRCNDNVVGLTMPLANAARMREVA